MNNTDKAVLMGALAFLSPFFVFDSVYQAFITITHQHGFAMSGVKFAILATFGEVLGQRIRTRAWSLKGSGVIPKMIVWYVLGVVMKAMFIVFSVGDPMVLNKFLPEAGPLLTAFSISLGLNLIFAPIFMTLHKITDLHIADHHGSMVALIKPINMAQKFSQIDWNVQYGFVFKKTIPLFWIPAHTITFLLPPEFQVVFAASLGVALGVILALASGKPKVTPMKQAA
ncbi:Mpv17/PMP22 family protein [Vibrio parahaemolyticus]|nr:Mpv17/PMP22 family protein [Vibrio parahaemolyticus]